MATPKQALAAIFPQTVVAGRYTFSPPTLLHLAAIDRLGARIDKGRLGADASAKAGFILAQTDDELLALMALPDAEIRERQAAWALGNGVRDYADLNRGVAEAINAAFAAAVPGADDEDPQTGHPQTSDGPSK